ncbi:hypothetical protein D3C86_1217570 [compost metagenome]
MPAQHRFKTVEIMCDARLDVTADDGGDGALIFTDDRPCLGRGDHWQLRCDALDHRLHGPFVFGVTVGMQEGENDAVATGCNCSGDSLRHILFVRRELYLAGRQHAFGYAENPFTRDERFRPHGIEIVDLRDFQACNIKHVLEVFRGEQGDVLAVALDHRVDTDGGSMGEIGNVLRFDAVALFQRIEREKDFFSRRIGAGKHLQGGKRAGPIVKHGKIRK